MTLVADASALVEYVLPSAAFDTFAPLIEAADVLHVPALCDVEVVSALRTMLRSRLLTEDHAFAALEDYVALDLSRHSHINLVHRVLELRNNFSPCDATYIALAEEVGADLLTGDARLARAVRKHLTLTVLPE